MSETRFSRRYFFCGSLLAGAVPAGGFGSTPSLKAAGFKSVLDKLNVAGTVVLADSDLPDTVGVAHSPSIPVDRRDIGIACVHTVCLPHSSGIAA